VRQIGAFTVGKDEDFVLPFTIGALLPHVDHYLYVDTGSTDQTEAVLQAVFPEEIASGKLEIAKIDFGDLQMSIARNHALDHLRNRGYEFCIKLDADQVLYDDRAVALAEAARVLPQAYTTWTCLAKELYQYQAETPQEWFAAIQARESFFQMTRHENRPHVFCFPQIILRLRGALATGKWTDETQGKRPEGIYYDEPGLEGFDQVPSFAHYGWARPNDRQRAKAIVRYGPDPSKWSARVGRLHHTGSAGLVPFITHPQVFRRLMPQVKQVVV
jgi:hypothetical protein